MKTKIITSHSITGQHFCFEIITEDEVIDIKLKSLGQCGLEWKTIKKDELKELAEFILKYLENN